MAQSVQSVEEFVQDSFVPMVAVLSSDEAERVCGKNNLRFSELLRPFCRLTSEGHIRDPNNQLHPVKNLRICVSDVTASPAAAPRLDQAVRRSQPAEGSAHFLTTGEYQLSFSGVTPWFDSYRQNFLDLLPPSDHDFLKHHLACLLVASTSDPDPIERFQELSQEQHRVQHSGEFQFPRWFTPNTLKFYVLLHHVGIGDEPRADAVYEDMKQRYGAQCCHLLKINSVTTSDETIPAPWSQFLVRRNQDPLEEDVLSGSAEDDEGGLEDGIPTSEFRYGSCLSLDDHERIRVFVNEFTFRALLPHIEKNIRQLNDQLLSRKGLSRSLFTATRKWFGGGKIPEKSGVEPRSSCGVLYPPEAPELQIRKMADLCFLVQHYELAYSCYHTAKKDFLSDQAMLYAAGALEMAAVSAFLQPGAARPYPAHYMDTAIQTYRDVCRNVALAERCALLSADILKSQGKFADAAALLIKTTSEDSDLSSALLLEQAALCFISMKTPMVRKFSFHLVLAGHRYSKAGQRRHALRCYQQALQAYGSRGWALAEDHVYFTLGRQSFTLGRRRDAAAAFQMLLGAGRHGDGGRQTAAQQAAFLREFLFVHQSAPPPEDGLPLLPLPHIDAAAIRVSFGPERQPAHGEKQAATHESLDQQVDHQQAAMWAELEAGLVAAAHKGAGLPAGFRPTQTCLDRHTDNRLAPLAVVNEPVVVELTFRNPLKVPLALSDLSLLWTFEYDDNNATESDAVTPEILRELILNPEETKTARLRLLPHRTGQMKISGVSYELAAAPCTEVAPAALTVRGRQELQVRGPRLNASKEDKMAVRHGADHRLEPRVMVAMPLLEVFFLDFPSALLCGELRRTVVEFANITEVALCGLRVACTHRGFFSFTGTPTLTGASAGVTDQQLVPVPNGVLGPGESVQLPVWLRGPEQEGVHQIHFLFYYQSSSHRHRVLRHTAFICAGRSLSVRAATRLSGGGNALIFVDVENMATSDGVPPQFHIVDVSGHGQRWQLGQRIGPAPEFKLSAGERAKLCFRAVPSKRGESERRTEYDDSPGRGRIILSGESGQDDLDVTISVMWKTVLTEGNGQNRTAEGRVDVEMKTDGEKLKVQESLLLKFRSDLIQAPPKERGNCNLVQTELDYQQSLTHRFQDQSVCVVPVRLTLSSCCSDLLEVDVDLRNQSGSFSWVGKSRLALRLQPGQAQSVALRACFLRTGVYNLNTPTVSVRGAAQRQAPPPPALIVIT